MRFLVDAQLPPALCRWLRERGPFDQAQDRHEAEHVGELGLLGASDAEIAARAEADGVVPISKDEDFVTLRLPDRFGLIWLRCGNATNAALAAWLEPRWSRIEALLDQGERFIEVRCGELGMVPRDSEPEARCGELLDFPDKGRARPELADRLRSLPHSACIIFYTPDEAEVRIERILHGARDMEGEFGGGGN